MNPERFEVLAADLDRIAAEIDDISLDQLREDLAAGSGRSATDRELMRARRSVEKARMILGGLADSAGRRDQSEGTTTSPTDI